MANDPKSIQRRSTLGVVCLALGYAVGVKPYWVEVNVHDVRASDAVERIRIAQLSDLHLQSVGRWEASIAELLQKIKPDLIVLSGDVVDRTDALPTLDRFLETLGAVRKVAVIGNWEHWGDVDLEALRGLYGERHGIRLLLNHGVSYRIRSRTLHIAGMDDFTAGQPDIRAMVPPAGAVTSVLVQHSPGWFEQAGVKEQSGKFALCLSGPTHGG